MGYDVMAAWEKQTFSVADTTVKDFRNHDQTWWQIRSEQTLANNFEEPPNFTTTTSKWSPSASPSSTESSPRTRRTSSRSDSPRTRSSSTRTQSPHTSVGSSPEQSPRCPAVSSRTDSFDGVSLATKLYAASTAGDVSHMKLLVSLGASVDAPTHIPELYESFKPAKPGQLSALAGAAAYGHIEAAEYLISVGAQISPDLSVSTSSPLHQACRASHIDMARYLLDRGADINQRNCFKSTPLMYAVKYGSPELVQLLLSYMPDLTARSFMGSSAAHWAIWPGRLDMLELLLCAGADANDALTDESTLLHCAALSGWADGVQLLLRHGADPERRDADWKTPLEVARANLNDAAAALLGAAAPRQAGRHCKTHDHVQVYM